MSCPACDDEVWLAEHGLDDLRSILLWSDPLDQLCDDHRKVREKIPAHTNLK
jgi:hypothetical protein